MKIHHLNCATMCPRGAKLLAGEGGLLGETRLVTRCLVIETGGELVVVDTGVGVADTANPKRFNAPTRALVRPKCDPAEPLVRQMKERGLDPADARRIVVTHLDFDHAGGLGDFPEAEVHVFAPELAAALDPPLSQRPRYVPAQWSHGPNWAEHQVDGDSWFGFESVRLLPDLPDEIVMVPLLGHTIGHAGVAINTGQGWLLHCGDAYFHGDEVESPHSCPAGLRIFQSFMAHDNKARRHNQERLRDLAHTHGDEVRLVCAHDPRAFDSEVAADA
jgi:glyoxylase-like metal-dependent hydrolase (beta-lactamase superfamily II)